MRRKSRHKPPSCTTTTTSHIPTYSTVALLTVVALLQSQCLRGTLPLLRVLPLHVTYFPCYFHYSQFPELPRLQRVWMSVSRHSSGQHLLRCSVAACLPAWLAAFVLTGRGSFTQQHLRQHLHKCGLENFSHKFGSSPTPRLSWSAGSHSRIE